IKFSPFSFIYITTKSRKRCTKIWIIFNKSNIESVEKVLEEISAHHIPALKVYNKIDLLENFNNAFKSYSDGVCISVKNKFGIVELKNKISDFFNN
ncbi:MAG TPA: hypothetical protein PK899_10360, partial [Spirochaetota bacterium]|nr:hypothetical protein [Spirochaetota bacterium]